MTRGRVSKRVVADRLHWIDGMVKEIRSLPLESMKQFEEETRNIWAAESCLRRALEALLDVGRHILAKSFGKGVSEYKEIAEELGQMGVLSDSEARVLRTLAGYRNRLVHFYHEVTIKELHEVCKNHLGDLVQIKEAYLNWLKENPDRIDETL